MGKIFPKRVFSVQNTRAIEFRTFFQEILIDLSTRFQLKQKNLMFWTKFTKKDISSLKQNESFPSLGNVSMVET